MVNRYTYDTYKDIRNRVFIIIKGEGLWVINIGTVMKHRIHMHMIRREEDPSHLWSRSKFKLIDICRYGIEKN